MSKLAWRTMIGVAVLLGSIVSSSGVAQAGTIWCATDLGPMATTAEAQIAGTPGGDITADMIVPVPSQAVSTEKGGSNPHK